MLRLGCSGDVSHRAPSPGQLSSAQPSSASPSARLSPAHPSSAQPSPAQLSSALPTQSSPAQHNQASTARQLSSACSSAQPTPTELSLAQLRPCTTATSTTKNIQMIPPSVTLSPGFGTQHSTPRLSSHYCNLKQYWDTSLGYFLYFKVFLCF